VSATGSFQSVHQRVGPPTELLRAHGEPQSRELIEQAAQRDLRLDAGQRGAEALVDLAVPER
jgi:hypothetical protein